MLNIFGWYDSRDVAALKVADYTEDQVMADLRRFAQDYMELVRRIIARLADSGTLAKSKYGLGVGGEMQPYAEAGATEAARTPGAWDVGYPILRFRSRALYTEEYLATVTLDKLEKDVIQATVAHHATVQKMLLRALLRSANYNFDDGAEAEFPKSGFGTLGVKRLCNNDASAGEVWFNGNPVSIGTLQHYFGSNSATLTINAFKAAYAKLKNVGLTSDVVFLISTNDEDTVRGFAEFKATNNPKVVDPNKSYAIVQDSRSIGRLEGPGISAEVIVEPYMPTSYVFGYDRAGGQGQRPLYVREHPDEQFRGFRLVQDETRTGYGAKSLVNKRWEYIAGAGVRNRVNGVVFQVVASALYTDPASL